MQWNKLFIGNLSYKATEKDVKDFFSKAGVVLSVRVPKDMSTGLSRGIAIVEMDSIEAAEDAMKGLDGSKFMGREIRVSEARPKEQSEKKD